MISFSSSIVFDGTIFYVTVQIQMKQWCFKTIKQSYAIDDRAHVTCFFFSFIFAIVVHWIGIDAIGKDTSIKQR